MKLIRHNDLFRKYNTAYNNIPKQAYGAVVALGNFDGVHKGHQIIIQNTVDIAKSENKPSAVLTFLPHPLMVLRHHPEPISINNFAQKFRYIEKLGIDYMTAIAFTNEFSTLSGEDFIAQVLVGHLKISHIIVGDDFIFGRKRSGDINLLKKMSQEHGFSLTQISTISNDISHVRYSSSKARTHIENGDIQNAVEILGHDFIIQGRVIKGQQKGTSISIPTANIALKDYLRPRFGVYVCEVKTNNSSFLSAICNIGNKPTFDGEDDLLEVHIFDFNENIYGQKIDVKLIKFLRDEKKFDNVDALVNQIHQDIAKAKEYFSCL